MLVSGARHASSLRQGAVEVSHFDVTDVTEDEPAKAKTTVVEGDDPHGRRRPQRDRTRFYSADITPKYLNQPLEPQGS